jgi:hypothetical protein
MDNKLYKCFICKNYLTSEFFYKDSTRRSGYSSKCKKCLVIYKRLKAQNSGDGWKYGRSEEGLSNKKLFNKLRRRIRDIIKDSRSSNSDIGCSGSELRKYLESKFKQGMSWDNHGWGYGKWVIDHIRPLADFIRTGDDITKANHYSNLQPLWYEENSKKGSKVY